MGAEREEGFRKRRLTKVQKIFQLLCAFFS